jgi:hypothetical protein
MGRKPKNGNGAAVVAVAEPEPAKPTYIATDADLPEALLPQPAPKAEIVRMTKPRRTEVDPKIIESILAKGDLSLLTAEQRVSYYGATCESLGLNPLTRPFEFITLNGKTVMYAKRDCADQLRKIHGVSITKLDTRKEDGVYIVVANAQDRHGRIDTATGVVSIEGARGETLANAIMKAETKAKRRVTLSLCGLGMLDESELDSIEQIPVVASAPIQNVPPLIPPTGGNVAAAAPAPEIPSIPPKAQIPTEQEIMAGAKQPPLTPSSQKETQTPPPAPGAAAPSVAAPHPSEDNAKPQGSGYIPQSEAATNAQRLEAVEAFLFGAKTDNRLIRYLIFAVAVPCQLNGPFLIEYNKTWHPAKWNEAVAGKPDEKDPKKRTGGLADRGERIRFIEQQLAAQTKEQFLAWADALVKAARGRGVFGK